MHGSPRFLAGLLAGIALSALAQTACAAEAAGGGSVLQHHADAVRSGLFVAPGLTRAKARTLHRDMGFQAELEGPIRAQPLYWAPSGGKPMLIVATEQDIVYALDSATGAVLWQRAVGKPVPRSELPCGNIDPLGITGTPAIDPQGKAVYFDAMADNHGPHHLIFGLALEDGAPLEGFPIDVEAAITAQGKRFTAAEQNERGAVVIAGDHMYVAYSGHNGDCGSYHGWVVGAPLHPPGDLLAWSTRARGGGIWAPGGVLSDGKALYVATGNTFDAQSWGDGEAIIRLGQDLAFSAQARDFFVPPDWKELDDADADLGGANPLFVKVAGATPSDLVVALGKDGKAYLLDRAKLGGTGGAVLVKVVSRDPIITSPIVFPAPGGQHVVFHGRAVACPPGQRGDVTALRIGPGAPPLLGIVWCAASNGRGVPIVTTTDGKAESVVWIVGAEGDNRLHGFRGDNGAMLFDGGGELEAMDRVPRYQAPIAAGGKIYVAGEREIYAFGY